MSDTIDRTYFTLTDEAHIELALMSEHIRYMARLLDSGAAANLTDEDLRADAMTWWINKVDQELRRIVESAEWSGFPDSEGK